MEVKMNEITKILEAHKAITRIKGKEYAPTSAEIQEWIDANNKNSIKQYSRKAIFDELKNYCHLSKKDDFIELCEWQNGEGFDVEIGTNLARRFQLTWGEFEAVKTLAKQLDKYDEEML